MLDKISSRRSSNNLSSFTVRDRNQSQNPWHLLITILYVLRRQLVYMHCYSTTFCFLKLYIWVVGHAQDLDQVCLSGKKVEKILGKYMYIIMVKIIAGKYVMSKEKAII